METKFNNLLKNFCNITEENYKFYEKDTIEHIILKAVYKKKLNANVSNNELQKLDDIIAILLDLYDSITKKSDFNNFVVEFAINTSDYDTKQLEGDSPHFSS